jgi:hypothetical protein
MNTVVKIVQFFLSSEFLNWVFGSGLGASLYVLTKVQPYLQNRSYDRKYSSTYVCRFVIGVVSGVMLAQIGNALVPAGSDSLIHKLGPGVVAIIGGYSAEAVQLILQRLADVISAAVRGDSGEETKAKLAAVHIGKINDARSELADVRAAHAANDRDAVNKGLDALDNTLRTSSSTRKSDS